MPGYAVRLFAGFGFAAIGFLLLILQLIMPLALPEHVLPILGTLLASFGIVLGFSGLLGDGNGLTGGVLGIFVYVLIGVGLFAYREGTANFQNRLTQPKTQLEIVGWPAVQIPLFANALTGKS